MNTNTTDPTQWRYTELVSPNRTIHITNLEKALDAKCSEVERYEKAILEIRSRNLGVPSKEEIERNFDKTVAELWAEDRKELIGLRTELDRLHRILNHIASHGRIETKLLTINTTMGNAGIQRDDKEGALKVLMEEVESHIKKEGV